MFRAVSVYRQQQLTSPWPPSKGEFAPEIAKVDAKTSLRDRIPGNWSFRRQMCSQTEFGNKTVQNSREKSPLEGSAGGCKRRLLSIKSPVLIALILLANLFTSESSLAQLRNWRTFTNMRPAKKLAALDNQIYAATTGGLLVFDPAGQRFSTFTNAEGLASNDITAIAADRLGRMWIALGDGKINLLDPETGDLDLLIFDQERTFTIHDFLALGDTMYIAFDFGVGEYRLDKKELKETYQQLGLNFNPGVATTALLLRDRTLYVGTEQGIASASLDFPNLKAPQSWVNQTAGNGLPAGAITDLAVFNGQIVASTEGGIAILVDESWQNISAGLPEKKIRSLAVRESTLETALFAAAEFSLYRTTDLLNWQKLEGFPGQPNDVLISGGVVWGASNSNGIAEYDDSQFAWNVHEPNSPKTGSFSGLAVDQNGVLWGVSPIDGFLSFDGENWKNYEELGGQAKGDYRSIVVDDSGRVWMGVWGRGIKILTQTASGLQITTFDSTDGVLAGIPNNLGFVVVNDLTKDRQGNIWVSNLGAATNRKIAVVTPAGEWAYFTPPNASRIEIQRLVIDQFDQIWYGMRDDGVEIIDYRQTLFDPSDDVLTFGEMITTQLSSNRITGMAEDVDGTMWIGTNDGLFFWFANQVSRQFRLISNDITVVRVDPSNNKWVGTSSGFTIISSDNASLTHFTTENSPLVSNIITDFAFNPETGEAFIATTNGLSAVSTPFTRLRFDYSLLTGYPNPFILDGSGIQFTITNLIRQSGVSIYTEDGRIVREFPPGAISGAQAIWDGKNEEGRFVPSGIYLYVAHSSDGSASAAGKVAVVRK
jgi:ligand-binding sensor domain-containing protein